MEELNNNIENVEVENTEVNDVEQTEEVDQQNYSEPENQEQTNNSEETVIENQEDDKDVYEIPDFVPDSYIPPQAFDSEEDELDWYRENYGKVIDTYKTDEFVDFISNKYIDKFLELEQQNIEKLIEDNKIYELKTKYPQFFKQIGISSEISEEEIADIVYDKLSKEFGENYAEIYDVDEAADKNSISGKMIARQEQIMAEIQQHNSQIQTNKPMSKEDLITNLNIQYSQDFEPHGITKENYIKTLEFAQQKANDLSVKDFYKLQYFQEYIDDAYQRGLKDGKKNMTEELTKTGRRINGYKETTDNEPKPFSSKYANEFKF